MASYEEIRSLFNDSALSNRVSTAVIVAADGILNEAAPGDAARKAWANKALLNPVAEARRVYMAVLAANVSRSVSQIQGAPDTGTDSIQEAVDAAINLFIDADAGV